MTYPEVQFVAAPEDGAAVLFDFNDNFGDAPAQIVDGTFTLGIPSLVGDPDGLGVEYGPRTVAFDLLVFGSRQAACSTQALLARTFMLRRRGWLRVRMDEFSSPVWLRTYTPTPGELDFELVSLDMQQPDAWRIEVQVAAEPLIRGERIELGPYVISNNPDATTNPMSVTLPAIVGDAPAPLRIEAAFSETRNQVDILWSVAAVPDNYAQIVWDIGTGDGWTLGSDTQSPTTDTNYSNGSYRFVNFSATEDMTGRLDGIAPSEPPPGRYKVMLRQGRITSTGTFAFRFGYQTLIGQHVEGSPVAVVDRFGVAWVDLGDFDFPTPRSDVDLPVVAAAPNVALQVQRLASSEWVALDAFMLIPLALEGVGNLEAWEKSETLVSEFGPLGPQAGSGDVQIWDGDSEISLRQGSDGVLDGLTAATSRGQFPRVRPGVNNHLTVIQQARTTPVVGAPGGTADVNDVIARTVTVNLSYQPRWLWLGGA